VVTVEVVFDVMLYGIVVMIPVCTGVDLAQLVTEESLLSSSRSALRDANR
jgi:hypothetical protein